MINARCACGEVYNVSDDKRGYGLICAKCGQIIDLASPRSSIHRFFQKKMVWIPGCAGVLLVGVVAYISYSAGRGVTVTAISADPVWHLPPPMTSDAPLDASIVPPTVNAKPDVPHFVASCPTGTNLTTAIDKSGRSTLTIINGNKEDAIVKLVDAIDSLSPRVVYRYVYIDASDQYTISKISPGSYSLLYSIGRDWNRQDGFNENEEDYRFGKTLDFSEATTATDGGGSRTE